MHKGRILLIQPPLPDTLMAGVDESIRKHFVPLGLGYLASSLEQAGYEPEVVDMQARHLSIEDLQFEGGSYVAAGITCVTNTYPSALRVAKAIKRISPETKVVLGGPHVTFCAETVLRESSDVDAVVRGEGEYSFVELLDSFTTESLNKVRGISFKDGHRVVSTPPRPVESDLDLLPPPARQFFPQQLYSFNAIVASRGCPGKCIFCAAGAMSQHRFRVRRPESVIEELEQLQGSKEIVFYDNTFLGGPAGLDLLSRIRQANLNITWSTELRADHASDSLLHLLRECGCLGVQFGVESGSDMVLRKIGKGLSRRQIASAVRRARSAGLKVVCSFCFGHPFDTQETLQETVQFMQELRTYDVDCVASIVTPFPGTPIYEHAEKFGVQIHHRDWEKYTLYQPVMSTRFLTAEEIGRLFMSTMLESLPSLEDIESRGQKSIGGAS
ncbi:MAG: B12-binding domain-containing radical SAM protein [Betaproteobacteria bacterium]